ncbi:MAG: hypothetical protein ACRD3A_10460 [Terriglobales bacterium]
MALINRRDSHHDWALEVFGRVDKPLLTCEAVLAEAAFHTRLPDTILALLEDGVLQLAFDMSHNLPHLRDLAARFADRRPDLADLCLIRMSELHPKHVVVTVDEADFRIYRRNKREAIPLLCPPRR